MSVADRRCAAAAAAGPEGGELEGGGFRWEAAALPLSGSCLGVSLGRERARVGYGVGIGVADLAIPYSHPPTHPHLAVSKTGRICLEPVLHQHPNSAHLKPI